MFKRISNYWAVMVFCLSTLQPLGAVSGKSELVQAVEAKDISKLQDLLAGDINVDEQDDDGNTALHIAAKNDDRDSAEWLLAYKANPNIKGDRDFTPLHWAVQNGNKELVELLIDQGADLDTQAENKLTPLHLAAHGGHKDVVGSLLWEGADSLLRDSENKTPVELAKEQGHTEIVKELSLPLLGAAHSKDQEEVKKLLESGVDPNVQATGMGNAALHYAVAGNNKDLVTMLVAHDANPELANNDGETPLSIAKDAEYAQLVQIMEQALAQRAPKSAASLSDGLDALANRLTELSKILAP